MIETGYGEGSNLEDTESFSSSDSALCYTVDGKYNTQWPNDDIDKDLKKFQEHCFEDWLNPDFADITLGEYANGRFSPDFIHNNLYPRVNGMYFCAGKPEDMPFRTVMSYYGLQEGYGGETAVRKYFKGGSYSWIQSLEEKVGQANIKKGEKDIRVLWKETTKGSDDWQAIPVKNGFPMTSFDVVALAIPADKALESFFPKGEGYLPQDIVEMLAKFEYVDDTTTVHTDAACMASQLNSWRTYNIHVYQNKNDYENPYTITYVANRHQNDAENPAIDKCDNPQVLISCNPPLAPRPELILKNKDTGKPAVKVFRHQKISIESQKAQRDIYKLQGRYGVYYVNGYVLGAGLHEECLQNSFRIAAKILGIPQTVQYEFNTSANAAQYAPDYVLNARKKAK